MERTCAGQLATPASHASDSVNLVRATPRRSCLHLFQLSPPAIQRFLYRVRIFDALQPEGEPVKVALECWLQMCRLPFDVSFLREDVGVVRLAGVRKMANQANRAVGFCSRQL